MTAINNINFYRTNTCLAGRDDSSVSLIARAIGADDRTIISVVMRLRELKCVNRPTVIEIGGIEAEYMSKKKSIDRLFKYLKSLSNKNRLLKFTVRIGNMVYPI